MRTPAPEAKSPTETGQRTVATVFDGRSKAERGQTGERPCKYCSAPFSPVRQAQEFCPGGECRAAWWRELGFLTRPHKCRCGRQCQPTPVVQEVERPTSQLHCPRPYCKGYMIRNEDGERRCMLCSRDRRERVFEEPTRDADRPRGDERISTVGRGRGIPAARICSDIRQPRTQ